MISPKICHCIHPFFCNYASVSTPSPYCIGYSVIKDTVSSYCTKYTMCIGATMKITLFFSSTLFWDTRISNHNRVGQFFNLFAFGLVVVYNIVQLYDGSLWAHMTFCRTHRVPTYILFFPSSSPSPVT